MLVKKDNHLVLSMHPTFPKGKTPFRFLSQTANLSVLGKGHHSLSIPHAVPLTVVVVVIITIIKYQGMNSYHLLTAHYVPSTLHMLSNLVTTSTF